MKLHCLALLTSSLLLGCESSEVNLPVTTLTHGPVELAAPQKPPALNSPMKTSSASGASRYTARKAVAPATAPIIPPVLLTAEHKTWCAVNVGDAFPQLSLPLLGGQTTELSSLYGKQATVVLFWQPDRWMARTALADMQRDVAAAYAAEMVAVIGIPVERPEGAIQSAMGEAKATFPQLLDTDGKAFASVGSVGLPRIHVLDPDGKIVWFDIEYSEGTRRELWQTLGVLTKP